MKTTSQHGPGSKITTTVNGRINYSNNKKPLRKTSNQLRIPSQRSTKLIHKVEVVGDSHLKGSAVRLNQYLNTTFKVCSLTKPGANSNQLVCSKENELKCLGKSDVTNGGSYDTDKPNVKDNGILALMVHFIQNYSNTNIVTVNIPHRHDLMNLAKTNLCIQAYNSRLKTFKDILTCLTG